MSPTASSSTSRFAPEGAFKPGFDHKIKNVQDFVGNKIKSSGIKGSTANKTIGTYQLGSEGKNVFSGANTRNTPFTKN
jgi:hypothetical protein